MGYSRFCKAELGLGLGWGCSVPSARLTHSDAMSVKLIHIQISSVRLTHSCVMGVKLIHIEITSVRLTHRYTMGVKLIHIEITSVRLTHIHYGCEAHSH